MYWLILATVLPLAACDAGRAENAVRVLYLEPRGNTDPGMVPFRAAFERQVLPRHPRATVEFQVIPAESNEEVSRAIAGVRTKPPAVIVTAQARIAQVVVRDLPGTPLVLATMADPMQLGITDHEISPTTNVTGITDSIPYELKHIELLQELSPAIRHVGVLADEYWARDALAVRLLRESGDIFGLRVTLIPLDTANDLERIATAAAKDNVDAWFIVDTPFNRSNAPLVAKAVLATGKPSIAAAAWYARKGGGVMAYAPVRTSPWPRLGEMVKLILSGVPAREMPFDRPKRFVLIVNRERARAVGMEIPRSILMRADEIIQ